VLRDRGLLDDAEATRLEAEATGEIDSAVAFAEAGTWEPVETLTRDVYTPPPPPVPAVPPATTPGPGTRRTTYRDAIRAAVREALARDPRVFLMGEDVGRYGGAYAVSKGLLEEFGPERIRDTPLSESGFVGAGIGAALGGARPIVEVMTVNFCLLALDQIVNNAATIRHMSGGQFSIPLVIRMATGAGRQLAAQHAHSLEGWLAHIPGLRVVAPATIEDARGMLWTALEDPDPVLIFEHQTLYNLEGDLAEPAAPVDLDRARVRREGTDATVIAYGATLHKALAAATTLAAEGVNVEVIDLRTLRPLDMDTITASVQKTRRVVIADEGWRSGSLSAEIAARIGETLFYELDAPIARVCTAEVPIPYPRHLEEAALPQPETIAAAVRALRGAR
jgi:pyruvate dehydrogenase E1 component beta subunit/2-oxoisovalerate dehydrogenase E1 component